MLKIDNLVKTYPNGKKAVDNITLEIKPGMIYGFIGANGAGKTTTLKAVVGIHNFDSGTIEIGGMDITKDPIACKKLLAYIPDNPDLYENLTGIQFIHFIADIFAVDAEKREQNITKYSEMFGMTEHLGNAIADYSHGMQQRIALIAALVHEPKLLLLDEPFVGLDPKAALALKNVMKDICAEGGAIFFSTHVLEVAEKLCDNIAIIDKGKLIISGKTEDVIGDKTLEDVFMEVQDHA